MTHVSACFFHSRFHKLSVTLTMRPPWSTYIPVAGHENKLQENKIYTKRNQRLQKKIPNLFHNVFYNIRAPTWAPVILRKVWLRGKRYLRGMKICPKQYHIQMEPVAFQLTHASTFREREKRHRLLSVPLLIIMRKKFAIHVEEHAHTKKTKINSELNDVFLAFLWT